MIKLIASFSKNFVYIRTRKTASTTTEIVLGGWCSRGDVVTPVGPEDEVIRVSYGGEPRNFCSDYDLEYRYRQVLKTKDVVQINLIYREVMRLLSYNHHMSAKDASLVLDDEFWAGAFKFAFDRDPYEKVISLAYWRKKNAIKSGSNVCDFLCEIINGKEYRNFDLYSVGGKLVVDKVFKYEDLSSNLNVLAEKFGCAVPAILPLSKSQHRKDKRPAREILTRSQMSAIYEACAEEFELLGYSKY